jgi:hypothetical protein
MSTGSYESAQGALTSRSLVTNQPLLTTALTVLGYLNGYIALSLAAARLHVSVNDFGLALSGYLLFSFSVLFAVTVLVALLALAVNPPNASGILTMIISVLVSFILSVALAVYWADGVKSYARTGHSKPVAFLTPGEVLNPQRGAAKWKGQTSFRCVVRVGSKVLLSQRETLVVSQLNEFKPGNCKVVPHF